MVLDWKGLIKLPKRKDGGGRRWGGESNLHTYNEFKSKKDKDLKVFQRGRKDHIQRTRIIGISGFSTTAPDARRQWGDIFKVQKKKNLEHRILYATRLSFKCEVITKFPIKHCPRQCNRRRKRN